MRLNCHIRQNAQKRLTLSYVKCIIVYRKCFFETKMNRFTFETLSITHIFRRVFMKANKVLAISLRQMAIRDMTRRLKQIRKHVRRTVVIRSGY